MRVLNDFLRGLRRDQRGVSAVEFALVAPMLILFYFGLAEATQVMMAERKTIRTASAIGDLVAQNTQLTSANIDDIFKMSEILMTPYPATSQLKICVASIVADADNIKTVSWSRAKNSAVCPAKGATVATADVPAALIDANQSLIMSRVTYEYTGPTNKIIKTNPTFTKVFYLRPRQSHVVACATC
jgi:Flp pilus assembly protein TadG